MSEDSAFKESRIGSRNLSKFAKSNINTNRVREIWVRFYLWREARSASHECVVAVDVDVVVDVDAVADKADRMAS